MGETKMGVAPVDSNKVEIWISYINYNGEDHLFLHDSYNNCDLDSLTTKTFRGDSVIWSLDTWSGIDKLKDFKFEKSFASLMEKPAEIDSVKNKIKLKIKADADTGKHKYSITFKTKDKDKITIDPYIRVPPEERK